MPSDSTSLDWEGELAVIIGETVRDARGPAAEHAIAGYAVFNDVTVRDYQYRTTQWFQGKTFEGTSPLGPYLVTADELAPEADLHTDVDGETVQHARIDDLLFGASDLVEYISHIVTLNPGDIIATGTPGGVGQASDPPRYLTVGSVLTTTVTGLGSLRNEVIPECSGSVPRNVSDAT
jgi:acylpyruvate hydrolase